MNIQKRSGMRGDAIVFIFCLCAIFPSSAFAYLDPGTGSYFFQILAAGLFAFLYAVKLFWRTIIDFFKIKKWFKRHD